MSATALKNNDFAAVSPVQADAAAWVEAAKAWHPEKAPDWVRALRATAADVFSRTGLPLPKSEGWQYTNLRALKSANHVYTTDAVTGDVPPALVEGSYRIVLQNGQFRPELSSLPAKVEVLSLMQAAEKADYQELLAEVGDLSTTPFKALNTAFLRDGFVLKVPTSLDVDQPIEVVSVNQGTAAIYPRMLYWMGKNSGAVIIERHLGTGAYFQSASAMIEVADSARLKFYRILKDDQAASHFNYTTVRTGKDAVFEGFSMAIGGQLLRQDWRMQLINSRISTSISGIYMIHGKQNHDISIVADHFEPDCSSVQHFKGVIDDQARAVFQGKIHVHRPAQKTDGYQSHHALLLSDKAEANTKPELEIYADDVKCSHGATAGFLNPDSLFYLQSRGIPKDEAKALLIDSFLAETLERVSYEPVKEAFASEITSWLSGHRG